ncbi:MAG: peptidylprolyl isomerase [Clostridia bacterium]|nr:peptidylprolyl isomerase [Clostridia bacterium]
MKRLTSTVLSVLLIFAVLSFAGCGKDKETKEPTDNEKTSKEENMQNTDNTSGGALPTAVITLESGDKITLELYPDKAPNTVANFISLANKGFYNGTIFHRVIKGFMMQGGDPEGTGYGGPGYAIKGEFTNNGFKNDLKFERGTIGMGRSNFPDTAGSQFFICQAEYSYGNGNYAAFGKVTDGIEVVDKVCNSETDSRDRPLTDVIIKSITVDTHGADYGEPVTIAE